MTTTSDKTAAPKAMFKGLNDITINSATLILALEHWMGVEFTNPPKITSVQWNTQDRTLRITTKAGEEEPKA